MIRNECDIVELFLRINLRQVDIIHVIDHCSDDGTAQIVQSLMREGLSIRYLRWSEPEFQQARVMTAVVRHLANQGIYDYIVPIDGDEFLVPHDPHANLRDVLAEHLPPTAAGRALWRNYCPVRADYFSARAPLYENFRQRQREGELVEKLILGAEFARHCIVSEGNHAAWSPVGRVHEELLPVAFSHFPVRSPEQIIRKSILGSAALALKPNRKPREGYHWDLMADLVRARQFKLDDADLLAIAMRYPRQTDDDVDLSLAADAPLLGHADDCITLPELAVIRPLQSMDERLTEVITMLQEANAKNAQRPASDTANAEPQSPAALADRLHS